MRSHRRRDVPPGRGQALVEFALVAPVLILILSAIIQCGMVFWAQNTLNQIARDTGRWAATQTSCGTGFAPAVTTTAQSIASQSALVGYGGSAPFTVETTWSPSTGCVPSNNQQVVWVKVVIHYTVPQFLPVFPFGDITSSAEYRMEPAP